MDGNRFDSLTKAMATWMTRRRLFIGLFGGAAGVSIRSSVVHAQGVSESDCITPIDPRAYADMGPEGGPQGTVASVIQAISSGYYTTLKDAVDFKSTDPSYPNNGVRFEEYVQMIKCIAEEGANIDVSAPNDKAVGFIISQLNGVNAAMSIAFSALSGPDAETLNALRALQTPPAGACQPPQCLQDLFVIKANCEGKCISPECKYPCRLGFATDLITKKDKVTHLACLEVIQIACEKSCCGGVCKRYP